MPGAVVRLTQTVDNPDADRRARHDWRLHPQIFAGQEFVCEGNVDVLAPLAPDLRPVEGGRSVASYTDLWWALVQACQVVTPSIEVKLDLRLRDSTTNAGAVLARLITEGTLTWQQVDEAIQHLDDEAVEQQE